MPYNNFPVIPSSEITPEEIYLRRRDFIKHSLVTAAALTVAGPLVASEEPLAKLNYQPSKLELDGGDQLTPYADIKRYNNFYEFGTDKTDPARYAQAMTIDPWSVTVSGEVDNPGVYALEDILAWMDLEERIYRLRCVEAWSMVIPWVGFSLAALIKKFSPTSKAKYIQFETLSRKSEMKGMQSYTSVIDWPYREGLRIDEAMNPLTFMATGLYGRELPKQNGAPLRLVVPWKYGFKSIKSIVGIRFVESQPQTTWQSLAPNEYGFYANVNPSVDHPRWSQKTERRLPTSFLNPNRVKTQLFNGYQEQVAYLYKGMDLRKYY